MASLTRDFDWGKTPLGSVTEWPNVLLITVNTLLASRQPMFLWWGENLVQFYNDAYRPSIGRDKHPSALGQRGKECWPEIWPIIGPQIEGVLTHGIATWNEDQLVPIYRDGQLEDVYWTYSYSPIRDTEGVIRGVLVTCSETTGRILAEQRSRMLFDQLQASEERLRVALSTANGVGTWDWDVPGDRVFADEGFARTYGVDPEYAAVGAPIAEFIRNLHPDDRSRVEEAIASALKTGNDYSAEHRLIQSDGSIRWVLARGRCSLAKDGTPLRFLGVTLDITDQKLTTAALLQNEKLAAVGRLAASIAHEINNPLESVTNLLYLARKAAVLPEVKGYLDTAEQELRRVAAISSQTLQFHKQATSPTEVQCAALLEGSARMYFGRIVNSNVSIEMRDRCEQAIRCFEGEIRQVLNNLVSNAIDAMSQSGGRLLLRSRPGRNWKTGESGIILTVADTGRGMTAQDQSKAFQAFFTTKGIGGTGLGLWISHEIAVRHRGRLTLRSSQCPGHAGSVFTLFLPFDAASR
jgi:PAS domain S-box-containing protein